jgi:hypothetical protein
MPSLPLAAALTPLALQAPMTLRLVQRTRKARLLAYAVFGFERAFWRGAGVSLGVIALGLRRPRFG